MHQLLLIKDAFSLPTKIYASKDLFLSCTNTHSQNLLQLVYIFFLQGARIFLIFRTFYLDVVEQHVVNCCILLSREFSLTNANVSEIFTPCFFYSKPKMQNTHTQHSKHEKHGCINLNDRFFLSYSHFTFYFSTSISKAIFMLFYAKDAKNTFFRFFRIHTQVERERE